MTKVTDAKLITTKPIEFATNTLQIAVAKGNPKKIQNLKDLTDPGLKVVLCEEAQPCGAAAPDGAEGRRRHREAGQRGTERDGRADQGGVR